LINLTTVGTLNSSGTPSGPLRPTRFSKFLSLPQILTISSAGKVLRMGPILLDLAITLKWSGKHQTMIIPKTVTTRQISTYGIDFGRLKPPLSKFISYGEF
jgi:hypothetical protein